MWARLLPGWASQATVIAFYAGCRWYVCETTGACVRWLRVAGGLIVGSFEGFAAAK